MGKSLFLAGMFTFMLSVTAFARNPVGEFAEYKLDKNGHRTSSILRSGDLKFTVVSETSDAYNVKFDYKVRVLGKRYEGEKEQKVAREYFDSEFMSRLKKEGELNQGQYKIKYLGTEDVKTIFNIQYPGCDKIFLYDFQKLFERDEDVLESEIITALVEAYQREIDEPTVQISGADVKDLEVTMRVTPTIPVLGAVKFDVSGKVRGITVRAGFDYQPH